MTDGRSLQKDWIREQIAGLGLKLNGEIAEVKANPTSTVLYAQTDTGKVYFKAPMPAFAFEAGLTAKLAEWFPAKLPEVLAIDRAKGWLLMRDSGITVRELIRADGDISRWDDYIADYVSVQQETASRIDDLLALGVPDRRLDRLPALYQSLIADRAALLVGQKDGISEEQLAELPTYLPTLRARCTELAAFNIPQTLHHDDFHTGNTTVQGENCILIDWGESCIAHPMYSLVIVLRDAKFILKRDQQTLDHLVDVYLGCWTDYEPMPRLRQAFNIAAQLAALCRTLTWYQFVSNLAEHDKADYADAVPYWLLTFLNNTPFDL